MPHHSLLCLCDYWSWRTQLGASDTPAPPWQGPKRGSLPPSLLDHRLGEQLVHRLANHADLLYWSRQTGRPLGNGHRWRRGSPRAVAMPVVNPERSLYLLCPGRRNRPTSTRMGRRVVTQASGVGMEDGILPARRRRSVAVQESLQ